MRTGGGRVPKRSNAQTGIHDVVERTGGNDYPNVGEGHIISGERHSAKPVCRRGPIIGACAWAVPDDAGSSGAIRHQKWDGEACDDC